MHVAQSGAECDRANFETEAVIGDLEGELATARVSGGLIKRAGMAGVLP